MVKWDVVVIGCGGGGIAAALTLARGGAKVIVLEKASYPGGSTNFVEGTYAVESKMQLKRNIKATCDEGFKELMNYSHWKANAALVRAIVNKSGDTIDWLQKEGVSFAEPTADFLGGPRVWHLFKGFGKEMIRVLVANAKKKGVKFLYETTARGLLREVGGPVTGVVGEDKEGRQIQIEGKAIIIATGGFANNKDWIKRYTGFDLDENLFAVGRYHKTGDGIRMAWEAGAAEEGIGDLLFNFGMPPGTIRPQDHMLGAVGQPTLWVNQQGTRFCDEAVIEDMIHVGNILSRQPGRYCFRIFDKDMRRHWAKHGGIGVGNYCPPRTPLTNLDTEMRALISKGNPYVFVADALDALADEMGIDQAMFMKTVEVYNRFCDKGHDDSFAKDPAHLQPVRTPPFYAFKCYTDFLCTLGGIRINENTEVLDKNNKEIPGLYATGCDAGGMYGDSYDITASGIGSAFALNSGRIAGERVLGIERTGTEHKNEIEEMG